MTMARATKSATRAKKAPAPKPRDSSRAADKPAAKKPTAKKAAAKKAPAKKAPAKKAAAKKAAAKKAPAKKATAKAAPAKKAAATKKTAAKKKPTFDKKFLDQQRTLLLTERARYVASADSLKAEADALVESREPGDVQFDEESGEGDTIAVERERDLALSAHARAAVDQIDAALARIESGAYGICVSSGLPIPKERLRAIPWANERGEYKAGGLGRR
jgi:RNA polymerase-binding transcription factor DksA